MIQFERSKGGLVELPRHVASLLCEHAQISPSSKEAGGILLGRQISGTLDIVLDEITTPSIDDRQTRFSFFRSKRLTQARIEAAWTESSGTLNYLGEWHTHPEDTPRPSCIDRAGWRSLSRKGVFQLDSLLFVIVGRNEIGAWELQIGSRRARRLKRTR